MYGYDLKTMSDGRTLQIADPEKALSDMLYLYPEYSTTQDMLDLRLDEEYLQNDLKKNLLQEYISQFKSKTLEKRVNQLFIAYGL
jgi:hypothetical protein